MVLYRAGALPRAEFTAYRDGWLTRVGDNPYRWLSGYALPAVDDWQLTGDRLSWTSAIKTPSPENNLARARLFLPRRERRNKPRAAIV